MIAELAALALNCAPNIHPITLQALVRHESRSQQEISWFTHIPGTQQSPDGAGLRVRKSGWYHKPVGNPYSDEPTPAYRATPAATSDLTPKV